MKMTSFVNLGSVPECPGLYEIHTNGGRALKVGIAGNLRLRLSNHFRSRQSRLKLVEGGSWRNPDDVRSKQSILAKHLFFDGSITSKYDLKTEEGRRSFLEHECVVRYVCTADRNAARTLEQRRERSRKYRYCGRTERR